VANTETIGLLGRLGRRVAYLPTDGATPADPRLPRLGRHLMWLADYASTPGQQVILAATELLGTHYQTAMSSYETQSLPHRPLTEKGKEAGLFRVWEPTVGGATGAEMVSNGEDCFGRLSLKRRLSPRPVFSPAWEEAGILRRTYNLSTNCEAAAEGVGCMAVPRSPLITPKRST
jgi:hypothetical protein